MQLKKKKKGVGRGRESITTCKQWSGRNAKQRRGNQTQIFGVGGKPENLKRDRSSKRRRYLWGFSASPCSDIFHQSQVQQLSVLETHTDTHTQSQLLSEGGATQHPVYCWGFRPTCRQRQCVCATLNEHTLSICWLARRANANVVFFICSFVAVWHFPDEEQVRRECWPAGRQTRNVRTFYKTARCKSLKRLLRWSRPDVSSYFLFNAIWRLNCLVLWKF